MNTSILKNGLLAIAITTTFTTQASTITNPIKIENQTTVMVNEISITISKNTTDHEFKEIISTLKKHHIEAEFTHIKRNKRNEIIGLKIKLNDEKGNSSSTALKSKNPIDNITLGAENGTLYITSKNNKSFSFNGTHSQSKHFDFSFDDQDNILTINGKSFNFDEIGNKLKTAFNIEEDDDGKRMVIKLNNFDFNFEEDDDKHEDKQKYQKFHFVDDPSIEKHIVIDGKKSNFKKLDELAKNNQLSTVDFLKPETATSVYGKKGKDGAIIATTK